MHMIHSTETAFQMASCGRSSSRTLATCCPSVCNLELLPRRSQCTVATDSHCGSLTATNSWQLPNNERQISSVKLCCVSYQGPAVMRIHLIHGYQQVLTIFRCVYSLQFYTKGVTKVLTLSETTMHLIVENILNLLLGLTILWMSVVCC